MNILYLSIILFFISCIILTIYHKSLSKNKINFIIISTMGFSIYLTINSIIDFFNNKGKTFNQILWYLVDIRGLEIPMKITLDKLSLTMFSIVIGISSIIYFFSIWYMKNEKNYAKFFIYMNFFVANMLLLIISDNLLFMYFGWECVGLCSYLLINFYYKNKNYGKNAIKSFITTKISDIFLLISIFIFYNYLGTISIQEVNKFSIMYLYKNNYILQISNLFLLIGAIGKSAQFPMYTWLPDAMSGPTPASALIHAATMVTAGIYLIVRMHKIFILTPNILYIMYVIGLITLIISGLFALTQRNIKKILAYSTISQLGYIFLSLGICSWQAAIFHLITHSYFKALLFLSAGSLIKNCSGNQNIFTMNCSYKNNKFLYICFLIGGSSLSALPLITSGFYSKEYILLRLFSNNYIYIFYICILGTFITSLYTFRMIFYVFHEKYKKYNNIIKKNIFHNIPLLILCLLSTVAGLFIQFPYLDGFICKISSDEKFLIIISCLSSIFGIIISYIFYKNNIEIYKFILEENYIDYLHRFFYNSFFLNSIYDLIFVKPYLIITFILFKIDFIDKLMYIPVFLIILFNNFFNKIENGYLRWYIYNIILGVLIMLFLINILHIHYVIKKTYLYI
ncbi:NADH-quinone oxidoreductase subunit L [Candidatus Annandia adelgestsuga]|uniref:NADH-quinone oxidoreductase subunit L n=1 Tax=Candidatus Annandia adelgestsuga TaxID=1302411 RepID=A0A3Q9CLG0_9ENTR|nr:NADH-quinone oxidoreductase subunit L [Candidatus Annandia adelgestsuga]AZP36320.1 NADH-quinone oxidoreductase subunit L [Candidatus Annandia adelgestsuga]